MIEIITAADDEYELEKITAIGPTLALAEEGGVLFNHQTTCSEKLLPVRLTAEQELKMVAKAINGQQVLVALNASGMYNAGVTET